MLRHIFATSVTRRCLFLGLSHFPLFPITDAPLLYLPSGPRSGVAIPTVAGGAGQGAWTRIKALWAYRSHHLPCWAASRARSTGRYFARTLLCGLMLAWQRHPFQASLSSPTAKFIHRVHDSEPFGHPHRHLSGKQAFDDRYEIGRRRHHKYRPSGADRLHDLPRGKLWREEWRQARESGTGSCKHPGIDEEGTHYCCLHTSSEADLAHFQSHRLIKTNGSELRISAQAYMCEHLCC